jgi:hypothetical protein
MNRRAALIASGALVALTLPLASPAGAAAPQRGCPPPFELLTYRQQVALAREVLGISRPEAVALIDETVAAIDHNGDRKLCYAFQNKHTGEPNIIDNTARSR